MSLRTLALLAFATLPALCQNGQHTEHQQYGSVMPASTMMVTADGAPNDAHATRQHYVVMVSLDGFRYDYPKEHGAPYMQRMMREGATAPGGMLPSYPSLTFPNHWTLVTGLYPEHHGITRNRFYDPATKREYAYTDDAANTDGSFYGGVPLWSLAEQQGMRAASFEWPGSQAEVAGKRPNGYARFQDYVDGHVGLNQVMAWLKLPPEQRPHLITMYLSPTDHAGHWYGPDSPEESQAVHIVDALMGELRARLNATGLPVDLIVVSDHGMVMIDKKWIQMDQYADLSHTKVVESAMYPDSEAETEKVYEQFKAHPDPRFDVYRRKDLPAGLHFNENARTGDPVIVVNGPYIVHPHATDTDVNPGDHGYDPAKVPQMKAFFLANGPDIRKDVKLDTFPNVDVYDFVAHLLDLKPAKNDGDLGPLKKALR